MSTIHGVINSNSFRNPEKKDESFALCALWGSDLNVGRGGENDINRHMDFSKHKGYVKAS